ncbi:uncharacterized protein [Linepithema humile]|uniref:uncharacterized protein n=1 Tax=Linepithema humile TaxID=83485 RepID=UPI00351EB01E
MKSAIGGINAGTFRYTAQIYIFPTDSSLPTISTTASILPSLTKYVPSPTISQINWGYLEDLNLMDPDSLSTDSVDIIIGTDLYGDVFLEDVRKGNRGELIAQETIFGWVLSGPTSAQAALCAITVQHCSSTTSLDRKLRRFWEIEEIHQPTTLSPEEQQCEEHFRATHSRDAEGRYIVRLPFKFSLPIEIGKSRDISCLRALQQRLKRNPTLRDEYQAFLSEYEELGHMRKLSPATESTAQRLYIPHYPVIRDSSLTTRVRVVFNASSRTSNNTSLNDHLLTGQKLQADLAAVILHWRQFKYVYSADIAKMYRQILVDPQDLDYQRIL